MGSLSDRYVAGSASYTLADQGMYDNVQCSQPVSMGFRPPGLEFQILCLEGSVNSFTSPSSGASPGPV